MRAETGIKFRNFDTTVAEVYAVKDFVEWVKSDQYNDYDGSVYYLLDGRVVDVPVSCHDLKNGVVDKRFKEVAWFAM